MALYLRLPGVLGAGTSPCPRGWRARWTNPSTNCPGAPPHQPARRRPRPAARRTCRSSGCACSGRRVDDPGDVARGAHHKALLALEDLCRAVGGLPGHDVVLARAVDVDGGLDEAEVQLLAAHRQLARLFQLVLQVGVPQVPAVHRARQVGGVAVPVEQVEGRRLLALEVVADHVVPDQVVRPQEAEGRGQLATGQQLRATGRLGAERGLAHAHQSLIDKDVEHAVVAEVDQRGQQGDRRRPDVAPAPPAPPAPWPARCRRRKSQLLNCGCPPISPTTRSASITPCST